MNKKYELLEIEIVLCQETDVIRTSSGYSGDSSDDWGYDIW